MEYQFLATLLMADFASSGNFGVVTILGPRDITGHLDQSKRPVVTMALMAGKTAWSQIRRRVLPNLALSAPITGGAHYLRPIDMRSEISRIKIGIGYRVTNPAIHIMHIGVAGTSMEVGMTTLAPGAKLGSVRHWLVEIDIISFISSGGVRAVDSPVNITFGIHTSGGIIGQINGAGITWIDSQVPPLTFRVGVVRIVAKVTVRRMAIGAIKTIHIAPSRVATWGLVS